MMQVVTDGNVNGGVLGWRLRDVQLWALVVIECELYYDEICLGCVCGYAAGMIHGAATSRFKSAH